MQNTEVQKQRQNFIKQIRKQDRQDRFSKKRNLNAQNQSIDIQNCALDVQQSQQPFIQKKILVIDKQREDIITKCINAKYTMDQFAELVSNILCPDIDLKHRGVIGIRKLISVDNDPPIQQVIDAQLIPAFIQMSKQSKYPQLQLQATWVLTNVCSGSTDQCQSVIEKGGIPIFVQLLIQNTPGIVDQAVWAIGNLSGDCIAFRDKIIAAGALQQLIKICNQSKSKQLIRQISWTISNLCRGTPLPKYDLIRNGIVQLCLIVKSGVLDRQNLIDSLWAISYACQSQKSKIQRVVQTGVVQKLVRICDSQCLNVLTPTLRILGNISVGNQLQTQQLLKHGIINLFTKLIDHDKKAIRREVCWIISNITAGTRRQVQQVIQNYSLIKQILHLFQTDSNQVKRQICYIFSNMTNMGQKRMIFDLFMKQNIIEYYARLLLDITEVKTTQIVLDTLNVLLSLGDKVKQTQNDPNIFVNQLTSIPGTIQIFQKLQYHDSKSIYNKTVKLIQKHFQLEPDLEI